MGHSLVFGRPCSPILDLRPSGVQSKGIYLKYDPLQDIGSTSLESRKIGIVGELTPSSCFQE